MPDTYSIYEAKAKLSEIVRLVGRNRSVVITDRGRPVAPVVPLRPASDLERRLAALAASGALVRNSGANRHRTGALVRRPGALARFLKDRNRY